MSSTPPLSPFRVLAGAALRWSVTALADAVDGAGFAVLDASAAVSRGGCKLAGRVAGCGCDAQSADDCARDEGALRCPCGCHAALVLIRRWMVERGWG